jgi:hypothetical protein
MKFEIKNIETLIVFFNKHFDKISDKEYNEIIYSTLEVFTDKKPKTKEEAIAKIRTYWNFIKSQPTENEKPLFFFNEAENLN